MQAYQYKSGDKPLEGYTIQRAVGRGGFGEVYYALSDGGRQVALKAVQTYEQIELRGIQQCMNLKSPHLVTVFDVKYNAQGKLFVIMEYVSGPSLGDMITESGNGLGTQKAAFFLREIAKGLNYLHECGIVHRDLKPGNIFYEEGHVKIGDYGLSKSINTSRYSNQTITVGTVHYMAPEIGAGKYDRSIDIYALGVILYEMLTGQVPYMGASPAEVLMKHMSATPDLSGIDETFARVIQKAMSRDPQDRYHTVQEMVEDVFGAEKVRQSMSQFSPQDLSMVAAQVAAKMPKNQAHQTPPPPPHTKQGQVNNKFKTASDRIYNKVEQVQNLFHQESGDELRAAAERDPMSKKQRILLALLTAGVLSFGAGLFSSNHGDALISIGILTFLMIIGGSAGILLSRHKLLNGLEVKSFRNWAAAAVAILLAALVSLVMWTNGPDSFQDSHMRGTFMSLIVLAFTNWWKLTNVNRKERIKLGPAVVSGAMAFGVSNVFHGHAIICLATAAGICLYVQIIWPFVENPNVKVVKPKPTPKPPAQPKQNNRPAVMDGTVSPFKRVWAVVLCGGIFMGIGGLQRFYVGKIGTGILWLFTGGMFGIGQFIDFILIITGSFKDSEGRLLTQWENEEGSAGVTPPPAPRRDQQGPTPQPTPAVAAQNHAAPPSPQQAASAQSTTIVVQDPNARGTIFSAMCGFVGYLLFIISILILAGTALHVPAVLASALPDDIPAEIEKFWGAPNWHIAMEHIALTMGLFMLAIASLFILTGRRRFGGAHIVRFIIAIVFLVLALVVTFQTVNPLTINGSLAGQPFGVIFDQVTRTLDDDLIGALFLFVASMIVLIWPPKRQPPQIVTMNPAAQNQQA